MPHTNSAKKRARQALMSRQRNRAARSVIRTRGLAFLKAAGGTDQAAAKAAYSRFCSALDKAAKAGVIERNTAVRRKARAAVKLRAMAAQKPAAPAA
jgi:small subunit ribosomal protein S20